MDADRYRWVIERLEQRLANLRQLNRQLQAVLKDAEAQERAAFATHFARSAASKGWRSRRL